MQYYRQSVDSTIKELESNSNGLSDSEANSKRNKYGYNELDTKANINPIKIFIEQFKSFIIYILLFAVAFSILIGEKVDAMIILAILIINAFIGFFQELSAQKSLEALRKLNKVNSKVYRDGQLVVMDSKYLVPGDIIYLEAGDKVSADCRLIECSKLKVDESTLTGESVPVGKFLDVINKDVQIGDQKNMVFLSTNVSAGTARAIVISTGMETEIGKITKMIKEAEEELTPLQRKLNDFGKKLGYVIIGICIFIFLVSGIKEYLTEGLNIEVLLSVILIAISLAVAAVPEGLPAVVTISLSIGVKRLLKKKALVRKLSSVETLGSCDVICTDKTGTLTKNEMTVRKVFTIDGSCEVEGAGYTPQGVLNGDKIDNLVFEIGAVCNNASVYRKGGIWTITGDPTEAALVVSAKKAGAKGEGIKFVDEIPFDSDRKMMSVEVAKGEGHWGNVMFTKGAPDIVLDKCKYYISNGKKKILDANTKKKIHSQIDTYSREALRVLAFAYKDLSSKKDFVEKDLVFVGLQAMIDPPRPDVIESIQRTKDAGIRVIMITGDHRETAVAIGKEIGIYGEAITGEEITKMTDLQLINILKKDVNIFARVIPEHKQRIVAALQKLGHIVAMTGDGVNDAPALKKANIGVAVGSGTDVAKEAADFVLLDDSFSNIVNAIEEGRGIYDNIQKVIIQLLSGNMAEVLIIFFAVLLDFNLPLTAVLLLWINLVTDGAPALALSVDPYDEKIMKKKPIDSKQGIVSKTWWFFICFRGVLATLIGLILFSTFGGNDGTKMGLVTGQTVLFTFVVVFETLLLLMVRRLYNVKMFSNGWLWATIIFSFILQGVILYSPFAKILGIVPLNLEQLFGLGIGIGVFFGAFLMYDILHKLYFHAHSLKK